MEFGFSKNESLICLIRYYSILLLSSPQAPIVQCKENKPPSSTSIAVCRWWDRCVARCKNSYSTPPTLRLKMLVKFVEYYCRADTKLYALIEFFSVLDDSILCWLDGRSISPSELLVSQPVGRLWSVVALFKWRWFVSIFATRNSIGQQRVVHCRYSDSQ